MGEWNPIDFPINKAIICDNRTPGVCFVSGAAIEHRLEINGSYGMERPPVRFMGRNLAEFKLEFVLTTRKDWSDWQEFRHIIE
ncbi:MAG TPA: hypothetical protein VIV60_26775, partial [Polyangiaceae bacterium]